MHGGIGAMDRYQSYTNEELVEMFQEGNEDVAQYLLSRFIGLIAYHSDDYFIKGADREDVIQEGRIGLYKAMRDYNRDKGCSFNTFADLCIVRSMLSAVKQGNRLKHSPLNDYSSLTPMDDNSVSEETAGKVDYWALEHNPADVIINQENFDEIMKKIDEILSKYERQVLDLYIKGMDYKEIAELKGKTVKSIDNALQRIRKKLREVLDGTIC